MVLSRRFTGDVTTRKARTGIRPHPRPGWDTSANRPEAGLHSPLPFAILEKTALEVKQGRK
jgi:hypothetical protein